MRLVHVRADVGMCAGMCVRLHASSDQVRMYYIKTEIAPTISKDATDDLWDTCKKKKKITFLSLPNAIAKKPTLSFC